MRAVAAGRAGGAQGVARASNWSAGVRAWFLVLPLVAFIGVTFIAPLGAMLTRSIHEPVVADVLPEPSNWLRRPTIGPPGSGSSPRPWELTWKSSTCGASVSSPGRLSRYWRNRSQWRRPGTPLASPTFAISTRRGASCVMHWLNCRAWTAVWPMPKGRLWVLLGGYRADLENMLPDALAPRAVFAPVPAGIPADLLVQRPDVSAARQRVEAARYAVGVRRAEILPSLSLSGSIGLQSSESSEWFDPDQWFRNLSVNLLAPVFQGGRLRGNLAFAEARLKEAAAAFGQSVVTAVNEVEAALAGLQTSRRRLALLTSFVEEARAEAALQEQRYVFGAGDYAVYLAASQIHVGAQSALAAAERDLGYARLALHRSLGGAWTSGEATAAQQDGLMARRRVSRVPGGRAETMLTFGKGH